MAGVGHASRLNSRREECTTRERRRAFSSLGWERRYGNAKGERSYSGLVGKCVLAAPLVASIVRPIRAPAPVVSRIGFRYNDIRFPFTQEYDHAINRSPAVVCLHHLSGRRRGAVAARSADEPSYTRTEDVVYGRKFGTALTMDVFTPKKDANGAAVVLAVSGGWVSSHETIPVAFFKNFVSELSGRGYTVFAVVHGSQPRFTIPEILEDMHRAVRFVRYHAQDYHIDTNRIGITGGSAGGHLSCMQSTAGKEGDPKAKDPVDRVSSRVQAAACFYPPTDFLNYGEKGKDALGRGILSGFKAPFDFHEFDTKTRTFVPVSDEEKRREIGRRISPVYHVSAQSAPTLIVHGDADKLVPIQQAETLIAKLREAGVPTELVVKPGAAHGWAGQDSPAGLTRVSLVCGGRESMPLSVPLT